MPGTDAALQRLAGQAKSFAQRRPLVTVGLVFAFAKLVAFSGAYFLLDGPDGYVHTLSTRWDATHYLQIARHGYERNVTEELADPFAFAPVFPALIRLAGANDFSPFIVANLLALPAVLGVTWFMGLRAGLFLSLFPTFLAVSTIGYSETTYVALASLALVCLAGRRDLLAGATAASAILTRYGGILLALGYVRWLWKERRWRVAASASVVGLVALGVIAFIARDPIAIVRSEAGWGLRPTTPWGQVDFFLHGWYTNQESVASSTQPAKWLLRHYLFVVPFALGVFDLWYRNGDRPLAIGCGVVLVFALISEGAAAISAPRLLLLGFPAVAVLGKRLKSLELWAAYAVSGVLGAVWFIVAHVTGFTF